LSFENYVASNIASSVGENYENEKMTTNNGHTMLLYAIPQEGRIKYQYLGYIDYTKSKKLVVLITASSETYRYENNDFKLISAFSKDEFEKVCKSFKFID
jgi:hypothetical protein